MVGRVSKYRGDGEEEKSDSHAVLTTCSSISHELCVVLDSINYVQIERAMRWAPRCSQPLTTRARSPFIQCLVICLHT